MNLAKKIIVYLFYLLVLLLPFHALLINQLPLNESQQMLVSSWKELVIATMALLSIYVLIIDTKLRKLLASSKLLWSIIGVAALHLLYVGVFANTPKAELIGLRTNLSFLAVFVSAMVGFKGQTYKQFARPFLKLLLGVATVVAGLALLQSLAPSWTSNYINNNSYTNQLFLFVQDGGLLRVNSSLWGPSQLASFLVLPISLATWQRLRTGNWLWSIPLGLMVIALYATHSRATWAGTAVAVGLVIGWSVRQQLSPRLLVGSFLAVVVAGALVIGVALKVDGPLSRIIFHSESSEAFTASSNSDRWQAIRRGLEAFGQHPLGSGPGSAGPASSYNSHSLYTESYYVQLLVEIGLVGLVLFLLTSLLALRKLWQLRNQKPLAIPVAAAAAGLMLMNVVHHTWSDAATAIIWWGAAGALIGCKPARGEK